MNPPTLKEAESLFLKIAKTARLAKNTEVIICAPNVFLSDLKKKIRQPADKKISLGAQNVFYENNGPYTGEISSAMLKSLGIKYVIVGHSKRREMGENNESISRKLQFSLKSGLTPILCVGELQRDHNGDYLAFIKKQINECLKDISKSQVKNILFVYEPVWAISNSRDRGATPEEFVEASIFIKKVISDIYDAKTAHNIKIIYGGSVDSKNAKNFLLQGQADGLLIGVASLKAEEFNKIITIADKK